MHPEPAVAPSSRDWRIPHAHRRPVAVAGLVLVAIGNGLLIGLSANGNVYVEALPGTFLFALGGGPLFVCATTSALGRVGQHEAGLVSGVVNTFNQLGAAICVALASTVAAAGLTRTPSLDGFTDAFTLFTVVAAVAAVLSLRLVPSGTPQMTGAQDAH
jgi:MFS family permease